ncbi:MAG TPA: DUF302 domain-containing protein [Aquifex aeolicus]|nr:DUF302 domain-containing protein [Aquifex aeolicus]
MRAILFLAGGLLLALGFIFYAKHYLITPKNMFFFTVEVPGGSVESTVKALTHELGKKGLGVVAVLSLSDSYTLVLSCDVPQKKEVLLREPFMGLLLPCGIGVYEDEGKAYITSMKETLLLREYSRELGYRGSRTVEDIYQNLRIAIAEVVRKE